VRWRAWTRAGWLEATNRVSPLRSLQRLRFVFGTPIMV
jgi:hypothetical protein